VHVHVHVRHVQGYLHEHVHVYIHVQYVPVYACACACVGIVCTNVLVYVEKKRCRWAIQYRETYGDPRVGPKLLLALQPCICSAYAACMLQARIACSSACMSPAACHVASQNCMPGA